MSVKVVLLVLSLDSVVCDVNICIVPITRSVFLNRVHKLERHKHISNVTNSTSN